METGAPRQLRFRSLGRVFTPGATGAPWMARYGQSPVAIDRGDQLRVFFTTRALPDAEGNFVARVASLDVDRDDPTRVLGWSDAPLLDLGQRGCFDEFGTSPLSIVDRGAGELWLYYAGWTRCVSVPINAAIGVAVSHDGGGRFERLGPGPVLGHDLHEPYMVGSPRVRWLDGRWWMHYAGGRAWAPDAPGERPEPLYRLSAAVSDDGVHWERHALDPVPTRRGPGECQACAELWVDGEHELLLFSHRERTRYRDPGRGYRLALAHRPRGSRGPWTRDDGGVELVPSGAGWDSEGGHYGSLLDVDGRLLLFYQGNGLGDAGFGVAELGGRPWR